MDEPYSVAFDQYSKVRKTFEPTESAYRHEVGDLVQLRPGLPTMEVVERRHGAFGAVYIVRSTEDGSRSAVKSPRADRYHGQPVATEFANEATTWRNLPAHPCVLPALAVFSYDRAPYVQMPYVPPVTRSGSSLEAILVDLPRNTALAASFVTLTLSQVLNTLAFLEESVDGFAHGDIKPSNLLLRTVGGAPLESARASDVLTVVSDFGLARALTTADAASAVIGDRSYLPPERLRPHTDSRFLATAQDVYAVGCTAIELLLNTRWQAPREDGTWVNLAELGLTNASLKAIRPDIGSPLIDVVWKCLAGDPDGRWSSFSDLASAWTEIIRVTGTTIVYDGGWTAWRDRSSPNEAEEEPNGVLNYLLEAGSSAETATRVCAHLWDASQHRAVGRFTEAASLVTDIRDRYPTLAAPVAALAHGFALEGRGDEAVETYLAAVRLYEDDERQRRLDSFGYGAACATLAQILSGDDDRGRVSLAVELGHKAVRCLPSSGRAHLGLGLAQLASGDFESSVDSLDTAARLDSGHRLIAAASAVARALSAGLLLDPGALAHLSFQQRLTARQLWEKMSPAVRELDALLDAGQIDEAIATLRTRIAGCRQRDDRAGEAQATNLLGGALARAGRSDESADVHHRAAAQFMAIGRPNSGAESLNHQGLALQRLGRHEDAVAAHERAAGIFATTGNVYRRALTMGLLTEALAKARRTDEAVSACVTGLSLWRELGDKRFEALALDQLGVVELESGRFERARAALEEARALSRALGDQSIEGATTDNLGLALSHLNRHEESVSAHLTAITLLSGADDRKALGRALSNLAGRLAELGRFPDALEAAERAIGTYRDAGESAGLASALNNRGLALVGLNRFEEAVASHRQAARLRAEAGDRLRAARALNNMGAALQHLERITEAIEAHQQALRTYTDLGQPRDQADALTNLGSAYDTLGRPDDAAAALERAATIYEEAGETSRRGTALNKLGAAVWKAGRLAEAVTTFRLAAEVNERAGNRLKAGMALHNLGMVYRQLGRLDDAVHALRADADICRQEGDLAGEAQTLENLASILSDLGHHEEAASVWRRTADALAGTEDHEGQCTALIALATLLIELQRAGEAVTAAERAVRVSARCGNRLFAAQARMHLGIALLLTGQPNTAASRLSQAKEIFTELGDDDSVATLARLIAMAAAQRS